MSALPEHHAHAHTRRAYTLAELVVAMGASSVLLVGAGVVLTSTMKQVDRGADGSAKSAALALATDTIAADAAVATSIDTSSPGMLSLTVPDRTGDGTPESIVYRWTGTAGSPLTRTLNNNTQALVPAVSSFVLAPLARSQPTDTAVGPITLAEHVPSGTPSGWAVGGGWFVGLTFRPALPANAVSWTVTGIDVMVRSVSSIQGSAVFQLREVDGSNTPTSVILTTASVPESTLPSTVSWITVPIAFADIPPSKPLALVVGGSESNGSQCGLGSVTGAGMAGTFIGWSSSNNGSSWSAPSPETSFAARIRGTYTVRREN